MRWRRLLIAPALVAAVAVAVIASGKAPDRNGRPAPALPSAVLVAPAVTLASLHGHPVLVNFWASWCDPCRKEAPELSRFSHGAGAGRLVGVDWNDSKDGARRFIARYGWRFPNLRDGDGTVGNDFGLSGLPTTFVLDRRGRVIQALRGPQTVATLTRALRAAQD